MLTICCSVLVMLIHCFFSACNAHSLLVQYLKCTYQTTFVQHDSHVVNSVAINETDMATNCSFRLRPYTVIIKTTTFLMFVQLPTSGEWRHGSESS
jgi:hypothetical protein